MELMACSQPMMRCRASPMLASALNRQLERELLLIRLFVNKLYQLFFLINNIKFCKHIPHLF